METIVVVLMILVCFNFMMKQTFRKRGSVAAIAVVAALFVGLMCPYAIQQSKTQIADWLADAQLMLDTSVVLTVEVALQMAFCMLAVHVLTTGPVKKRTLWAYRALRWFPGILIFPVLFSGLVYLIFSFPGVSFSLVAWSMAVGVLILISVGTLFLRYLLPEKELRLELLFLTNALTAILGIIATVNGRTAVTGISEVDWGALTGLIIMLAGGGLIGLVIYKHLKLTDIMNLISDILFWISNGLLVPVVVLLIVLFIRSLLLIGSFFGQYLAIRRTDALLRQQLDALTIDTLPELESKLPVKSNSLVIVYIRRVLGSKDRPAHVQRLLADFEITADKDLAISKTLTKMGPMLGLMGTLIPMGPALVGLSTGDIASMAYNMQVAFATTVVGLFSSAIGFITQQVKQRWYLQDMTNLEFLSELLTEKHTA